jgi:nucleoside-diphosphate-sugar epimerase
MKRHVLLTGATGFVGTQILKALLCHEVEVTLLLRSDRNLEIEAEHKSRVRTYYTEDLFKESLTWFEDVCRGVDTIVHSAWYAKPEDYLHSPLNMDCLVGTLNFAKGAVNAGVRKFVGIGTCLEYDSDQGFLRTDSRLSPRSPYAAAKTATFLSLSQCLPRLGNIEFAWCRLFYMYGENESAVRLVPYIRSCLEKRVAAELTDGNQIRDYMNVEDVGKKIVEVSLGQHQGPLNICSGKAITVRQFVFSFTTECEHANLLKFGARKRSDSDPDCIVGVPSL